MDVRCERCRAQYVFDDEQVTPSGLTVQCTNCGHVFKVKKKELVVTVAVRPEDMEGVPMPATAAAPKPAGHAAAHPAPPAPAAAPPEPERREWRVRQANGNVFTFRELTTLQKWIVEQKVARDDEISQSSDHQWKRLGNIAELASFFQVVEAAERSRILPLAPAVTPVPAAPVHGVAVPPRSYPPPPSGFPPPSFAAPQPPPAARAQPAPPRAAPETEEVDLGAEDLAAVGRRGRWPVAVALLVLAAAAGGAVWYLRPALPGRGAPAAEPVAVPITIEVRPAQPPPGAPAETPAPAAAAEAAPREVAPVPAPEPVVETVTPQSPEPLVRPEPPPPAAKPAPKGPKALLAQATKLREKGDMERALDLYGRLVAADPENVDALVGRGLCYLDLSQYAPAEASLQAALRAEPGNADALLGLAETYRWQEKRGDAITYYERYLAEHPDGDEAAVARNALTELRR